MNYKKLKDVNYWPGYVDALITVVLNLLLIVGMFVVGLVTINAEAIFSGQKAAKIRAENLSNEYSIENQIKASRALVRSIQKHNLIAEEVAPQAPQTLEIYFKNTNKNKETLTEAPSLQKTLPSDTPENIAHLTVKTSIMGKISFDINQFAFDDAKNYQLLDQIKSSPSSNKLLLFVIADPANKRGAREAFSRLVSTRNAFISHGVAPQNIAIRIMPAPELTALPADLDRNIFVTQSAF